ncbi:unnamed protein product [Lactuca saligna]|uniref:glutamine--fructose-6-phosphate transaminase (isomerizing) n=1 Tax=Lactuca saligna TaxID=75948 RepID=A0AA35ZV88_LACSI|nr:unnamed protein product [Lactuca saligna]
MPYREAKNGGEGTNGVYVLGGIAAAVCGPCCRVIQNPPVVDCLQPVVNIVPLQEVLKLDEEMKDLAKSLISEQSLLMFGVAHTRWATHGEPSPRNSHPQSSGAGNDFLVVHNGVITNYEVLKQSLLRHRFTFESETDTEVIPKLAKFVFDKANEEGEQTVMFSEVVLEVMWHLEGAYALIFKSRHYPNELVACKRCSPLLLGVKEFVEQQNKGTSYNDLKFISTNGHPKELFLSSDPHALVEHTKKVLVIVDSEVVHIKDGGVTILKFEQGKGKDKEIHEQSESLTTTMRGRLIHGGSSNRKCALRII